MTSPQPSPRQKAVDTVRHLSTATWAGIGGTLLLALIMLASGGIWLALTTVALVVLVTAIYGLALHRPTWLRLPQKRSTAALGAGIAFAVLLGSSTAFGATHPVTTTAAPHTVAAPVASKTPEPPAKATPTPTPTHVPVVTTREASHTSLVPYASKTVQDPTKAKGTTAVTTAGVNGVETKTYTVTFTDGKETARVLKSDTVTTPPVTQVTTVGTYVAPPPAPASAAPTNCTNGTYVNTAGNTVCRPEVSSTAPSGATAKCGDGTYSFSQSRRGTCSSHGGVAEWL